MALDLAALQPAPDKVVANLPYGIAATVLLRTIEELPRVALWVAMTQKEVGERLAASAGSRAYGAPRARPARMRGSRGAGDPAHRLPSGAQRRLRADRDAPSRRAHAAGGGRARRARAHRGRVRAPAKTLAGSLALAGAPGRAGSRADVRAALEQIGQPADARAERLSPQDFQALAGILRCTGPSCRRCRALAPAKINLGLFLGPVREADGRHELVSVMQSISLADELTLSSAPAGASATS